VIIICDTFGAQNVLIWNINQYYTHCAVIIYTVFVSFLFRGCPVIDSGKSEWLASTAGMQDGALAARGSVTSRVASRTYRALVWHVVMQ
jgi:hypothetical protein